MPNNTTTFAHQINLSQHRAMVEDSGMICMGLGIDDPKSIFGTTMGLKETFSGQRIFDMPIAENGMTGIAIGAAIAGTRVLMTHQRVDFFLLAMDQLVNNAAKWHYMFNGQMSVPITIRLIIGRGWGQGPTHQQSLQNWFCHIPGLKVITPGLTDNVGALLYQAIMDNNPTVFLEHRWLHNQNCQSCDCLPFDSKVNTTRVLRTGEDITLIANSYLILEAIHAQEQLIDHGLSCDVIEVAEPTQIDWQTIYASVNKTSKCLVMDIGHYAFSTASEITAMISENCFHRLTEPVQRMALPNYPEPTSFGLTGSYYLKSHQIVSKVAKITGLISPPPPPSKILHDVPGDWFKGPF